MSAFPFSMFLFALAASLSPGPVNLVGLGMGARRGFWPGMLHVSGATCGFTLLLVLIGFGLRAVLEQWPWLLWLIRWAGAGFFLFMAWKLWRDPGRLDAGEASSGSLFLHGALMQWLNPKAWLASAAGMGAFAADGDAGRIWLFAAMYFVVCFASLACWVWAGCYLRGWMQVQRRVRLLNRALAGMLLLCVPGMLLG
jgi:threonine/homoserine/homoserine lactone efflux protein